MLRSMIRRAHRPLRDQAARAAGFGAARALRASPSLSRAHADSRSLSGPASSPGGAGEAAWFQVPFTHGMDFIMKPAGLIPCYRFMGGPDDNMESEGMGEGLAVKIYSTMLKQSVMDQIMYAAQRQGRFSFYMTSSGEEAAVIGSAAGIDDTDEVFAQYREQGVLLWRGFTFQQFADQCYGNSRDTGKGRQMPIHYGSKELHYQTVSSPLATQMPQAVGYGYGLKSAKEDRCAVVYFGDGAASEGDAHAALNFAATLKSPVLFICRNNGWAISTPASEQYRGDGIAVRSVGFNIPTLRVDGSDACAMYFATREARRLVLETQGPVLLEAMAYRTGHHSTSDDSARYRDDSEMSKWKMRDPVMKFRLWLEARGWWDEGKDQELRKGATAEILAALEGAEGAPKPPLSELFTDVYDAPTPGLRRQEERVHRLVAKYPGDFPTDVPL